MYLDGLALEHVDINKAEDLKIITGVVIHYVLVPTILVIIVFPLAFVTITGRLAKLKLLGVELIHQLLDGIG